MFLSLFGSRIPEGKEIEGGYVILSHRQQYTIEIINKRNVPADAEIYLDGDFVGCYRLNPGQVWAVEHPSDSQQRFTFFKSGSEEASLSGESVIDKEEKGLVQVKFYPEKELEKESFLRSLSPTRTRGASLPCSDGSKGASRSLESGISGLSGHSDAQYGSTYRIDRDYENMVTITLRLVGESKPDATPPSTRQQRMSNPIPPSVQ